MRQLLWSKTLKRSFAALTRSAVKVGSRALVQALKPVVPAGEIQRKRTQLPRAKPKPGPTLNKSPGAWGAGVAGMNGLDGLNGLDGFV